VADDVVVRPVRPDEYERAGDLVVAAYHALPGHVVEEDYDAEIRDVRSRVAAIDTEVLVAVGADGSVLGGVTYVASTRSPWAEHTDPEAASFRQLAVHPEAQGRGIGRLLLLDVIERAQRAGRARIVIHSTPWRTGAHALYRAEGFERRPDLDWLPVPEVPLWGFVLAL
jgi:GNAT superfamily N-acetyltransferase